MRLLAVIGATVIAVLLAVGLYQTGILQFNRPSRSQDPVRGIDVSHHQGSIDWTQVASAKIAFAFIKATEGRDFVDPLFAVNWREARTRSSRRVRAS